MNPVSITEFYSGAIATLQFCRPFERNPLSEATLDSLATALEEIKKHSSIQVLILTGTADVFLSGANIHELASLTATEAAAFSRRGQELTQRIANLEAVTIAAINGYCMGGGLDFALACDIRIASAKAVFAHPGARLGIITGWGGTQRLPRLIGRIKSLELFTTARRLTSAEALEVGLVTQIGDPVLEAAIDLANTLVATSSKT
jgi:enoyl-CoA hydratase